jgi:hypothetical protein
MDVRVPAEGGGRGRGEGDGDALSDIGPLGADGEPPVPFFPALAAAAVAAADSGADARVLVGYLVLLATLVHGHPPAAAALLAGGTTLQFVRCGSVSVRGRNMGTCTDGTGLGVSAYALAGTDGPGVWCAAE